MGARLLIFGAGDVALKMASGLLQSQSNPSAHEPVRHIVFAEKYPERAKDAVEMLAACSGCRIGLRGVDGTDAAAVTGILKEFRPDLIVQAASLVGPWQIFGIDHPVAHALSAGGVALQAPTQMAVLYTVMRCVRETGLPVPVANISMPDIAHVVLGKIGLAPDIGLGNVSIQHLRARSALRSKRGYPPPPDSNSESEPLLRLVGHHHHVYGVMQAAPPGDPAEMVRVYVGDAGERDDALAYTGHPFPTGPVYNVITAASALPVIQALLPGGDDLRFSAPAPHGLPGGYPVRFQGGEVTLDLPAGASLDEAIAFNATMSSLDGVQAIEDDGTIHFTDKARASIAPVDTRLAEPFGLRDMEARTALVLETVGKIGSPDPQQ